MRLMPPASPEIWRQEPGYVGLCEHIARCAAICYNSEPKRGGEAVDFVKTLIRKGHGRPLEFGTLHVRNVREDDLSCRPDLRSYVHRDGNWVWTNLRAWLQIYGDLDDIEEVCDDFTADIDRSPRVTVHYPAIARGIADEFRTHATLSTLMQSTRYVRQGKDGDIEFVRPSWLDTANEETRGASSRRMPATRCRCASRRRWRSAASSATLTAGGTTSFASARPRRPIPTRDGWPRRSTGCSARSGCGLNSKDMTDKMNDDDSLNRCKYNIGDVVIFNSFFGEGSFEMLVCKITATYDDSLEYDLEAVDGGRIFDRVEEADLYRDKYSLHALFDDAVDFLLSETQNPIYFKD